MARIHWSDCAVNNGPAYPAGPCDCGMLEFAEDPTEQLVSATVATARSLRRLIQETEADGVIEQQDLPARSLVTDASPADLPHSHRAMIGGGNAAGVDLNDTGVPVVPNFKATT